MPLRRCDQILCDYISIVSFFTAIFKTINKKDEKPYAFRLIISAFSAEDKIGTAIKIFCEAHNALHRGLIFALMPTVYSFFR